MNYVDYSISCQIVYPHKTEITNLKLVVLSKGILVLLFQKFIFIHNLTKLKIPKNLVVAFPTSFD